MYDSSLELQGITWPEAGRQAIELVQSEKDWLDYDYWNNAVTALTAKANLKIREKAVYKGADIMNLRNTALALDVAGFFKLNQKYSSAKAQAFIRNNTSIAGGSQPSVVKIQSMPQMRPGVSVTPATAQVRSPQPISISAAPRSVASTSVRTSHLPQAVNLNNIYDYRSKTRLTLKEFNEFHVSCAHEQRLLNESDPTKQARIEAYKAELRGKIRARIENIKVGRKYEYILHTLKTASVPELEAYYEDVESYFKVAQNVGTISHGISAISNLASAFFPDGIKAGKRCYSCPGLGQELRVAIESPANADNAVLMSYIESSSMHFSTGVMFSIMMLDFLSKHIKITKIEDDEESSENS